MTQSVMILFDNTLYAQNQDYLPSRFLLQIEACNLVIDSILQYNDNSVGIAPIAQPEHNYILTPTNSKDHLRTFLSKVTLSGKLRLNEVMLRSKMALENREDSERKIFMFFGSDLSNDILDRTIMQWVSNIKLILGCNVPIYTVLFGEKADVIYEVMKGVIDSDMFAVSTVGTDDPFIDRSMATFKLNYEGEVADPDLEMALKLSLQDSNREVPNNEGSS